MSWVWFIRGIRNVCVKMTAESKLLLLKQYSDMKKCTKILKFDRCNINKNECVVHIVFVGPCVRHLFILYFQCGQTGLQLLASLDQLSLHGLLGTQMSHLREKDRRKCLRTSTTEWRRTKASPSPAVIKLISPYAPKNGVTRASLYLPLAHFLSHSLPLFFAIQLGNIWLTVVHPLPEGWTHDRAHVHWGKPAALSHTYKHPGPLTQGWLITKASS